MSEQVGLGATVLTKPQASSLAARLFAGEGEVADLLRARSGRERHPQYLGGQGEECWREIWHIVGPMMSQVVESGKATWSEDFFLLMERSGFLEETYFTFSTARSATRAANRTASSMRAARRHHACSASDVCR
jgi:hypothetical protein